MTMGDIGNFTFTYMYSFCPEMKETENKDDTSDLSFISKILGTA